MSKLIPKGDNAFEHRGRLMSACRTYEGGIPHYGMIKYISHRDCPVHGHEHMNCGLRDFNVQIGDNQCLGIYWLCIIPEDEARKDDFDLGKARIYGQNAALPNTGTCPGPCQYAPIQEGNPKLEDIADALTQLKRIPHLRLPEYDMQSLLAQTGVGIAEITTVKPRDPFRGKRLRSARKPGMN